MTEIKSCPKCNELPAIMFDRCSSDSNLWFDCGCGESNRIELDNIWGLNEILTAWESEVSKRSKPLLPKTWEECEQLLKSWNPIDLACNKQCLLIVYENCILKIKPELIAISSYVRKFILNAKLTITAEIYNDGWVWDEKSEFFIIFNYGTDDYLTIGKTEHPYTPHIRFKSREIAEEFAKNFGDMTKEFYSL